MKDDANRLRQQAVGAPATQNGQERTRVFILSDMRILRDAIALALSQESAIEVGSASDLSEPAADLARWLPMRSRIPDGAATARRLSAVGQEGLTGCERKYLRHNST